MTHTYTITIEKKNAEGQVIGTLTKTVTENDDSFTASKESTHTFGGDFFESIVGIESCEEALNKAIS